MNSKFELSIVSDLINAVPMVCFIQDYHALLSRGPSTVEADLNIKIMCQCRFGANLSYAQF